MARSRSADHRVSKGLQRFDNTLEAARAPSFETRVATIVADRLNARRPAPVRVVNDVILTDAEGNHCDFSFLSTERHPAPPALV